jgi:predicted nucleic acid-binding protein
LKYLVDTNVISALAPTKASRPTWLVEWMDRRSRDLFLSVITATEIRAGIAKSARQGAARKAESLALWWNTIEHLYGDRILAFDLKAATFAGALSDAAAAQGLTPGFADIAIASIAQANGLALLTRNRRTFRAICEHAIDPFTALPD